MNNGLRPKARQQDNHGLQQFALLGATSASVAAALIVAPAILIGMLIGSQGLVYCGLCFAAFLIPLYVGLRRGAEFDLFEPINLVAGAILFGSALRSVWLLLSTSSRVDFLMMSSTFDSVLANMPLILLSVLTFSVGYAFFPTRMKVERWPFFRGYTLSRERFLLALACAGGISLIGIPWMIVDYGITFDMGILAESKKRLVTYVNSEGELVYGRGFQRVMAFGAVHGFNLLVAAILARFVRPRVGILVIVAGLGIMAMVSPFLNSSRSSIILMFLNLSIFAYYYKRLSLRTLLIVLGISIFVLSALGAVRQENSIGAADDDMNVIDRVLGAGNSLDFVRTSAIIDRVPTFAPHLHGDSYAALIWSPIPRAMWPDKPPIDLGTYVKGEVFGQDTRLGGWPSGMIGEGWINFGMLGLFLPLLLFGMFLRFIYETVRPHLGVSFPITLIYALSIWRLGFGTIGMNFAQGMTQTLVYAAPTILMLIIARAPAAFRRDRARAPDTAAG